MTDEVRRGGGPLKETGGFVGIVRNLLQAKRKPENVNPATEIALPILILRSVSR